MHTLSSHERPTIRMYPEFGKHVGEMTPQILDIGGNSFLDAK